MDKKVNHAHVMTQPQKLALTGVLEEIRAERFAQVKKGYTPEHDDLNGVEDMIGYANARLSHGDPAREELVEMASVIVAAIEMMDRKAQA